MTQLSSYRMNPALLKQGFNLSPITLQIMLREFSVLETVGIEESQ